MIMYSLTRSTTHALPLHNCPSIPGRTRRLAHSLLPHFLIACIDTVTQYSDSDSEPRIHTPTLADLTQHPVPTVHHRPLLICIDTATSEAASQLTTHSHHLCYLELAILGIVEI